MFIQPRYFLEYFLYYFNCLSDLYNQLIIFSVSLYGSGNKLVTYWQFMKKDENIFLAQKKITIKATECFDGINKKNSLL